MANDPARAGVIVTALASESWKIARYRPCIPTGAVTTARAVEVGA